MEIINQLFWHEKKNHTETAYGKLYLAKTAYISESVLLKHD